MAKDEEEEQGKEDEEKMVEENHPSIIVVGGVIAFALESAIYDRSRQRARDSARTASGLINAGRSDGNNIHRVHPAFGVRQGVCTR